MTRKERRGEETHREDRGEGVGRRGGRVKEEEDTREGREEGRGQKKKVV